jgi:hypothetical protein
MLARRTLLGSATAGGVTDTFWIAELTLTQAPQGNSGRTAVDASGNIYVAAGVGTGNPGNGIAIRLDANGTFVWATRLNNGTGDSRLSLQTDKPTVDGSGNLVATSTWVVRISPSGVLLNAARQASAPAYFLFDTTFDSGSGSIYSVGQVQTTTADAAIIRHAPDLTINTARQRSGSSLDRFSAVTSDANNVYAAGQTSSTGGGGGDDAIVAVYNKALTALSFVRFGTSGADRANHICVVGGDLFLVGSIGSANTMFKLNSSLAWQWGFTGADADFLATSSAALYTASSFSATHTFAKYDLNGSVAYARLLSRAGASISARGISFTPTGAVLVSGSVTGTNTIFVAKLPNDGSLLGTYGVWTYASASLSPTSVSAPTVYGALTSGTPSQTLPTASLATTAPSVTAARTEIPAT